MNEINTTTSLQGNEVPPVGPSNPSVKVLERKNGMIAGVAGGLADYFGVDATIIRLVLLGLTILTMPAIPLAYIVAWIIIPEEGKAAMTANPA